MNDHDRAQALVSGMSNAIEHRINGRVELTDLGREFRGRSLLDLARIYLEATGLRTSGLSKNEIAGLAMGLTKRAGYHSTFDFPLILADAAGKTLRRAYMEAPGGLVSIARPHDGTRLQGDQAPAAGRSAGAQGGAGRGGIHARDNRRVARTLRAAHLRPDLRHHEAGHHQRRSVRNGTAAATVRPARLATWNAISSPPKSPATRR